jgi:hypothetical protein
MNNANQQAHQRSVERARHAQQEVFRRQHEAHIHRAARTRTNRDSDFVNNAGRGGVIRVIIGLVLLVAIATGVVLLISSGQLDRWFAPPPPVQHSWFVPPTH